MSQADTESNRISPLDAEYYQFCREQMRPYFGRVMWASQGLPLRHVVMQEIGTTGNQPSGDGAVRILEVGSWAGDRPLPGRTLDPSSSVQRARRLWDPWKPYFDVNKRPDAAVYREMSEALANITIDLFLHNITTASRTRLILPLRGASTTMLPAFAATILMWSSSTAITRMPRC